MRDWATIVETRGLRPLRVGSEQTRRHSKFRLAPVFPNSRRCYRCIGETEMRVEANDGTVISLITSWWLIPNYARIVLTEQSLNRYQTKLPKHALTREILGQNIISLGGPAHIWGPPPQ